MKLCWTLEISKCTATAGDDEQADMFAQINPPINVDDPVQAVREWFVLLGRYCAAVDYDSNESIFAPDVVSFGTKSPIVSGLGNLRQQQWEGIWGNICLLYTSPSPRDGLLSRMPSSA